MPGRACGHLAGASVETGIHYPVPPYRQGAFRHLGPVADGFPELDAAHHEVLSLPMGPHLTDGQQDRVIEAIASFNPDGGLPVFMCLGRNSSASRARQSLS